MVGGQNPNRSGQAVSMVRIDWLVDGMDDPEKPLFMKALAKLHAHLGQLSCVARALSVACESCFKHSLFTKLQEKLMKTAIKTQPLFTASAVAASFLAFGGAAMGGKVQAAEPAQSYYTTIVGYGDLNLDSEPGAKVLYARIRIAARNVCSSLESRELTEKKHWQGCFDKAVASAVGQVNNIRVTALHNQLANHTTKG
jgi:UrcA family protein